MREEVQPLSLHRRSGVGRTAHVLSLDCRLAGGLTLVGPAGQVDDADFGGPQPRLVTALLVLGRRRGWPAEDLADQLWPAGPPPCWRPAVRSLVTVVRHRLQQAGAGPAASAVLHRAEGYRVRDLDVVVDVEEADRHVQEAARSLAAKRYADAERAAGLASAVLERPVLPGVECPWADQLRRRCDATHLEALMVLGRAQAAQGRAVEACRVLEQAVVLAPFREDAWRALMRVELGRGNVGRALQRYDECRRLLVRELGAEPSAATRVLHATLLRESGERVPTR